MLKFKVLIAAMALVVTTAPVFAQGSKEPVIGQEAPAFTLTDSNGKPHSLTEYKGQTVVLEWTNHECPFVKKQYGSGNMQELQKKAADEGVIWFSIISSAPGKQGHVDGKAANKLTKERKASPAAVLLDEKGDVGRLYGAKTTPHMFVIDQTGTLVYAGAIDSVPSPSEADIAKASNYVTLALEEVKAGKPVTTSSAKSYGCAIKYE